MHLSKTIENRQNQRINKLDFNKIQNVHNRQCQENEK